MTGWRSARASACARGTRWPRSRFGSHPPPSASASPPPRCASRDRRPGSRGRHRGEVALAEAAPGGERERSTRDARIAEAAKADAFVELEALESDDDALAEPARTRAGDGDFQYSERLRVSFARASWGDRQPRRGVRRGLLRQLRDGHGLGSTRELGAGRARGRRRAPRRVHGRLLVPQGVLANIRGSRVRPGRPALAHGRRVNRRRRLVAARRVRRGVRRPVPVSRHSGRAVREPDGVRRFTRPVHGPDVPRAGGGGGGPRAPAGRLAGTVGTVRFWRDLGYAMGMPVAAIADASQPETALIFVACVMAAAGALVAVAYAEKHPRRA